MTKDENLTMSERYDHIMDNMRQQKWAESASLILQYKMTSEFDIVRLIFQLLKIHPSYVLMAKDLLTQSNIPEVIE